MDKKDKCDKFEITFRNRLSLEEKKKSADVQTFAEAARQAYLLRNNLGFDWSIESVIRIK